MKSVFLKGSWSLCLGFVYVRMCVKQIFSILIFSVVESESEFSTKVESESEFSTRVESESLFVKCELEMSEIFCFIL